MQNPGNSVECACVEVELELTEEFSWLVYANSRLSLFETVEGIECVDESESNIEELDRSYF